MSAAAPGRAPGCITYLHRNACDHEPTQQIPIAQAVRTIQHSLAADEATIDAAIAAGRVFYVASKIHSVQCPSVRPSLRPTQSWYWVTVDDDPQMIEERFAEILDGTGGGGYNIPGRLLTAQQAAQSTMKRCLICAPDVTARVAGKRPKKVAALAAADLGRLLEGHPIVSITHEPGAVIVTTRHGVHRFDTAASVVLDATRS